MVKTTTPSPAPDDAPTLSSTTDPPSASSATSTAFTPIAPTATTTPRKVVVNGLEFDFEPAPKTLQQVQVAIYSKEARALMDFKEKTELFERATSKKLQPKFKMMNLKIDDPDKLDDTYNLASAIDKMKENHVKYDLHDVFTIVMMDPLDPYSVLKTVDLYTDYGSIEVSDVASSNRFYATMLRDPNNALNENLKVTLEYLVNNTDENLVLKINETYLSYPIEERGGPLFFKLLMDLLQNNSAEAAEYLVNVVKNLKISSFDGENILKVVSLIRGAVKGLSNLKDATGQSALPKDLANHLLDVFQTSSVDDFNSLFKHFRLQSQIATFRSKSSSGTPSIDEILHFAETQYHLMKSTGKWTGVDAKVNATVFLSALQAANTTGTKVTICFNCGGSHSFQDCPKPKDKIRIKANRKIFKDQRKQTAAKGVSPPVPGTTAPPKPSTGKYSPPTDTEKQNKSRRLIDGKEHYYHYKTKRWNLVKVSPSPSTVTPAPPTTFAQMATSTDTPSGTITPVISNQTRDVAVANATRQLEMTFRGLLNQLSEG
jgi:hypothetical protein